MSSVYNITITLQVEADDDNEARSMLREAFNKLSDDFGLDNDDYLYGTKIEDVIDFSAPRKVSIYDEDYPQEARDPKVF